MLQARCFSSESPNNVQGGKKRPELDGPFPLVPFERPPKLLLGFGGIDLSNYWAGTRAMRGEIIRMPQKRVHSRAMIKQFADSEHKLGRSNNITLWGTLRDKIP